MSKQLIDIDLQDRLELGNIKQQNERFQQSLAASTSGYGHSVDGRTLRPCVAGISAHPGTQSPRSFDVSRAPESLGYGRDNAFVQKRASRSAGWTGESASATPWENAPQREGQALIRVRDGCPWDP